MAITIVGKVSRFKAPGLKKGEKGTERMYVLGERPFGEFRQMARTYTYQEGNGRGEQRAQNDGHVKKLLDAVSGGDYTPTTLSLGLYAKHRKALVIDQGSNDFSLEVDTSKKDNLLPITDGGHRNASLENMRRYVVSRLEEATDHEKAEWEEKLALVDSIPVPFMLHLDGDTKDDFVKLQLGRAVDRTHVNTLMADNLPEDVQAARKAMAILNKRPGQFFLGKIRISDTVAPVRGKGTNGAVKKLPCDAFCSKSASDLSTSMVGLARVLANDPEKMADMVVRAINLFNRDDDFIRDANYEELTIDGNVLQPLDTGGTTGGAGLYIGAAACLAFMAGGGELTRDMELETIRAALEALSAPVDGDMTATRKRRLMGKFASNLFQEWDGKKVGGVPFGLIKTVGSAAAYDVNVDDYKKALEAEKSPPAS